MTKNYYHILGLGPTASGAEIKAAYKKLALKFHPDKNPGNPRAEDQFKLVNEAYQVLSNPRRRATYDFQRQQEQRQRQNPAYYEPRYHHTRQPAGFQERHYRQRPKKHDRFSRRDIQIMIGGILLALLLVLAIKLVWDHYAHRRTLDQARQAEQEHLWPEAHELYSQTLDYDPDHQEARLRRASIRMNHLKDAQGAALDYSTVLASSPSPEADWFVQRGKCYALLKNHREALQDFDQAIKLAPSDLPVYQDRAIARLQLEDDWAAAISDLTRFLASTTIAPNQKAEAFLYRSFAHYRANELDKAWQDTERALAQDSLNGKAYYLQALIIKAQRGTPLPCDLLTKAAALGFTGAQEELDRNCPS